MFAKQLLHSSTMSVQDIGYACGFNSVRRFNDAFLKMLKLNPSQVRRGNQTQPHGCSLRLAYRGDYDWQRLLDFYRLRAINSIETVTTDSYQRVIDIDGSFGWFKVYADKGHCQSVVVEFELQDVTKLKQLVMRVRRMFDLDSDVTMIEKQLSAVDPKLIRYPGIRIPGVWSVWEAGVRAVLGQQVSVKAAISQLNLLVETLAKPSDKLGAFPSPEQVAGADLSFLRMPESRKQTLARLAQFLVEYPEGEVESWLALKGIGPWTVNYVSLRGQSQTNLFLDTDLIVKKYTKQTPELTAQRVSPWGSYATLHCWSHF
jgi:AraC family transcriptional regulator of adaptative response / DNA-3-methyladenine glycosylase II